MSTEDAAVVQFETDAGALGSVVISQVSAGRKNRLWIEVDGVGGGARLRSGAARAAVGRSPARRRRSSGAIPESLSPAAARYANLPGGHPQGYADCFDAFVADFYEAVETGQAPDGLPLFADGLRSNRITEAVLASAASGEWVDVAAAHEAVAAVKLGFLSACMPERSLEDIAAWAGANGYEALELAAWPRLGDRPFTASHVAADAFDDAEADRVRAALEGNGLVLSALAYYDNNLDPDPSEREANHAHLRACIDAAAALGGVPVGTFIGRDPGRSVADNLREAERIFPPLVDYAGERGVRLMIENCVMEGWHPDGYPGNLAYSPGAVGVDVRARAVSQLRPVAPALARDRSRGGAAARTWTGSRTRTRRTPRRSRPSATATGSSAACPRARRTPGTWAGGATGSRASARWTSRTTSTRSTRAASTASCRSSTRIRCGAGAPSGSRPGLADRPPEPPRAGGHVTTVLEVRDLVKEFPGVKALQGVNLDVLEGEVHCLLGPNGAGKSTLIKCISGVHEPTSGEILFKGEPLPVGDPAASLARGVATIYQELDLVEDLTVAESIFLAHEPRRGPLLDFDRMRKDSTALLTRLGHESISPRTKVRALRPAAQQIVSIARALSVDVRLLIMDEPSAILDEGEIETLFEVVQAPHRRRRRRGLHLPSPRRDPPHRQPRDRARRRPHHRQRHPVDHADRGARGADGRPQGGPALSRAPGERRRGPARRPRRQAPAGGEGREPPGARGRGARPRRARRLGPHRAAAPHLRPRPARGGRGLARGEAAPGPVPPRRSPPASASRRRTASPRRSCSTGAWPRT